MTLERGLNELQESGFFNLPLPGGGQSAARHRSLADLARKNLPLARLAEAHADAIAILAEAGRLPHPGIYGVWAAETAHLPLSLQTVSAGFTLRGAKLFCTGAGILDRALVSVDHCLLDVDLRKVSHSIAIDTSAWKTCAFAATQTAQVTFSDTFVPQDDLVGNSDWYLHRPGFWHGAIGPAACWAGGAMGLYDYAAAQTRDDAHTAAHLAAMHADVWSMSACLDKAGEEMDAKPFDCQAALIRALTVRHLIEQAASDLLRHLGRAYGPRPLAFDEAISKRYQEVELYIRQSHAERDLETLGRRLINPTPQRVRAN